jgi:hypothetical protein
MKKMMLVFLLIGMISVLAACGKKDSGSEPEKKEVRGAQWKYEKAIAEPIKVSSGKEDLKLGNLETNNISLNIPKDSFENETEIVLSNPDSVPNYPGVEIDTIGAPIEITANGKSARLNDKITATFKFDTSKVDLSQGTSTLRVAYYNGEKWDYIRPLSVDANKGVITFETYHLSLLGATKIKDETVLTESWIHSKTLDKSLRDNINKKTDEVANKIIDMGLEKLGISDKSIKGKILGELLKENDYRDIYEAAKKGDVLDMNQKIAVLAGKKMAEIIPASTLQSGLKGLTADSDDLGSKVKDVGAISQAAGNIVEGQYKDAAKIIASQILDKTTVGIAGKIAVEAINGQIESWKGSEVEAAYEAYKHGANGVFYGYNVDKGDFNSIWDQMRGIRRQIEIEAIRKENEGRADAGLAPLSEKQMDIIKDGIKESYRRQFVSREEKEAEFKKQEDDLRMLVDSFKKNKLLDSTTGPVGLEKGLDYEGKLDVLSHFADKMMGDTGRFQLSDKNGLIMADKISVDDIAQGARIWFSGPNGKKDYQKFLKDRFNIDPFPKLIDLTGKWNGSMTINDVILSDELKKQIAEGKAPKDEGCDFNFNFEELEGKVNPISFTISPTSETGGDMAFSSEGSKDNKTIPFTYSDGVISATMSEKGGVGTLSLEVSQDETTQAAAGSFNLSYKEGVLKILSSLSASKGKSK